MTNPVGRPLTFKTPEELQEAIDEYFEWCDNRSRKASDKNGVEIQIIHPAPYTMSGLSRRLGISRQALSEYSHKDEFGDTIIKAREKVQEDIETRMMETRNERGAMFNLSNNFGWKNKTETDLTSGGKRISIGVVSYEPKK